MDILQMRYLVQIYNDKSFTKAAKNLYISQQGLSKVIKNIEKEFQVQLFNRSVKGVEPTTHCMLMVEKCKDILLSYDEMVNCFDQQRLFENKTITIGIINFTYNNRLKKVLVDFQARYPDYIIEFITLGYYECEQYLENNLVDICLTAKRQISKTYEFIPLSDLKFFLFVSKDNPLYNKNRIFLKDLKYEKFFSLSSNLKEKEIIINYCLKAGFNPQIILSTCQTDFIIEQINLNKGIALLPEFAYEKIEKSCDNIGIMPIEDLQLTIEIGFLKMEDKKLNIGVQTFINFYLEWIYNNMQGK